MSVKWFVGCVFVGAAASVFTTGVAHAQTAAAVAINNTTQSVQAPTSGAGIAYGQGATGSLLKVYTNGFLFCGNPFLWTGTDSAPDTLVTLQTGHEDQGFTPAHPWAFPPAVDVTQVNYVGSVLNVNRNASGAQWTSLVCNGVGAVGDMTSGLADGIFDSGFDSVTQTNYGHLVNWKPDPQLGFDWNQPDWNAVPINPCIATEEQPAFVVEDTACAAVTGIRPDATSQNPNLRAGSMWTNSTESSKFTYVFRVDLRVGTQSPSQAPTQISLPTQVGTSPTSDATITGAAGSIVATVVDAYDSTYLTGTGSYCLLDELPATLTSAVCSGQTTNPLNGPLSYPFAVFPQPVSSGISSFYVAVVRNIVGAHASDTTPVVGASILVESAAQTMSPPADKFIGDDVVFGFMTNANGGTGFPWMQEP